MKPARKTRDFSINSILADTFMFIQNDRYETSFRLNVFKNDREGVENEECRKRNSKVNVNGENFENIERIVEKSTLNSMENGGIAKEVRITNHSKTNNDFSEGENSVVNFSKCSEINGEKKCEENSRKASGEFLIEKFYINSEEYVKSEACKNSVGIEKFERDKHGNKVQFATIVEKCTIDSKPNSMTTLEKTNTKDNKASAEKIDEIVKEEHKINSKIKFQIEEFNENRKKGTKTNDRRNSVRHLKKDRRRKIDEDRVKELLKNEIEVLDNRQTEQLNDNHNGKLSGSRKKSLEEKSDEKSEETENKKSVHKTESSDVTKKLEWLQFTRYKPPKIPRKKKLGNNKRKPSLHPRIPFSTVQLDFLEQKFRNSAYLSRNDVLDISLALKLPPTRVKIWFQNRRARERRELYAKKQ